jgi:hypothetical protein
MLTEKQGSEEMAEPTPDYADVLKRAKELCAEEGFAWDSLDFATRGAPGTPLTADHLLSKERRQQYLARARAELAAKGSGNA